ncbi:MAG: hypothetical protein NVSMB9_03270 [Isosphaeraceae bacterium]
MATLEVHDGQGRVERVTVTHAQPIMFGSSPKCDIVLGGDGVLPFHGRIRWQAHKKQFKVDASPDAEFLWVNGHKMASSSFRQGDEVQVGRHRIFLIFEGEPNVPSPRGRDDVTQLLSPSFNAPPQAGKVLKRSGWSEPGEVESPLIERAANVSSVADRSDERIENKLTVASPTNPLFGWRRLLALFSRRANVPGQESVVSSPLIFGLVCSFLVLVLVGFSLYGIIARSAASRLYQEAVNNLEDGDYRNAIRRFDEFLRASPTDERAGKARVYRALADVRQYTTAAGTSWSLALEAEQAMFDTLKGEPAFRDSSTELDELVLRTGEALAERARVSFDARALTEAEASVKLHTKITGQVAEALLRKSGLLEKLEKARAAVRKAQFRRDRLAEMGTALKQGSSTGVYSARDAMVREYPDQSDDRELVALLNSANELIRKAVTFDPSGRPAETGPRTEVMGPPTTLVLRAPISDRPDFPAPSKKGSIVHALADGLAYGLDGETGTPLWQVPVGLSSPFSPLAIPGGTTVLAVDARHDELIRLDARTGAVAWRQSLGERVIDPPLVMGNQIFQATPAGKLLLLDLLTGALRGTVHLGMRLGRAPVGDESGQVLYLAAERDCLFVLSRDPLRCVAVVYLGHAPGAIGCPPARVGRYLIVAENHAINESRWRIFVQSEDGSTLTPVQQVTIPGWTWATPASSGTVLWSAGDRNGVAAYAVGAYGAKNPFRLIAQTPPDAKPSGPAFPYTKSERELWVSSGRPGRYELNLQAGKLNTSWTLGGAGPSVAPPQATGSLLVLSQQNDEAPGVVLWGVEARTGTVRWRTVLGSPWSLTPRVRAGKIEPAQTLLALGIDGSERKLSPEALASGGFLVSTIPRPGRFRIPPGSIGCVDGEGWTAIVPAMPTSKLLVRAGSGDFKEVSLPAPLGARPIRWENDLFVPGADGRAYLIDPLTGESRAEPFVPPFDRAKPTRWRAPVRIADDAIALADEAGRVRRLVRRNTPQPKVVLTAETSLGFQLDADLASLGEAVVVATTDGRVRSLAASDLSIVGSWTLAGPLALLPTSISDHCFLADKGGGLLALGKEGKQLWSTPSVDKQSVPSKLPVGSPAVLDQSLWFLNRDGSLQIRNLADGTLRETRRLDSLPAGGPIPLGPDLIIPVGLGSFRVLKGETGSEPPLKKR